MRTTRRRRSAARRAAALWGAALAVFAPTAILSTGGPATADALLEVEFRPAPGQYGGVTVIGDSVLVGSALWGPTLVDRLAEQGWGPIQFRAGVGYRTGAFGTKTVVHASYWIRTWRSQGWDPEHVMINLGNNDSLSCETEQCAYDAIMFLVDVIGPGHVVWWPKVTGLTNYQARWNTALDRVAAERPGTFFTWDWPAVLLSGGFRTNDFVHLDADGYRRRSTMMARELTADVVTASRVGGDAPLPVAVGAPAEYAPMTPRRVLDTRESGAALPAGGQVAVDLSSYVPPGTTAVAVGLTTAATDAPGFLAGFPCDRAPGTSSNVNHQAGLARGSLAVIPLAADGRLCVLTRAAGHVIVDLQGAFVPDAPNGTRFTPLDPPQRLLDTRETGRAQVLRVTAPAGAAAVAVNLTATGADTPGWLKTYPCGIDPPTVSNVNFFPSESVASVAFVPVAADGTFCVETLVPVHVIVDITGVFTADGQLRFVAAQPSRVLDTRIALGGWSPLHGSGQTLDVRAVPPEARAVTGTITLVTPLRPGFLKAYPCSAEPPTSSVNALTGDVLANGFTVGVGANGRVCVAARAATHTLLDVTGWWVP